MCGSVTKILVIGIILVFVFVIVTQISLVTDYVVTMTMPVTVMLFAVGVAVWSSEK